MESIITGKILNEEVQFQSYGTDTERHRCLLGERGLIEDCSYD